MGAVGRVERLVGFEFSEEGGEGAEVVGCGAGVQFEDGGERVAEEEVLGCAAGLEARGGGGEAAEVGFGVEERVEPVYAAFVAVWIWLVYVIE